MRSPEIEVSVAGFARERFTGFTFQFWNFSATEAASILTHAHKAFKLTQTQSEGDRLRGWGGGAMHNKFN